ncbi:MAG: hypothetical protein KDB00_19595 [Planctomycetales bacterium]|nr:hypothetical protein [Planctomycetales bacterium]
MIHSQFAKLYRDLSVGNTLKVMDFIASEPSLVGYVHPSGTTALYFAVQHQAPLITSILISAGADVNPALPGRQSLIEIADALPSQGVYDSLKAAGARPKSKRKLSLERLPIIPAVPELTENDLPLCNAIGDAERFRAEAENIPERRLRRLLGVACSAGEAPFALNLIEILPSVNFSNDDAGCPLLSSACMGSLSIVRALRAAGARRDAVHAFHFAVQRGHIDVAKELVDEFLHRRNRNHYGLIADNLAKEAADRGYTEMAEFVMPYASARSAKAAWDTINRYRANYYDLAPETYDWVIEDKIPER